ncbi:hypothetical protein I4F81_008688 [Pyropia yezoensis]|uniref:Uncharacterized protein n=1 Tax=Pyropia yezoensis TaxID=2788 RepID=A0ACC3C7X1_PYRYE|nr:hypothetical protein I4F81_008688 [Neopyropia yezoensis]
MRARIVKRLLPTDATLVGDVDEYGAVAIAARVRVGPIGSRSSKVGSDMHTHNAGCAFTVTRQATAAEADAADVEAVTRRPSGYRVRARVSVSPAAQLEKQGFPKQSVRTMNPVPLDPGDKEILVSTSTGHHPDDWVDQPRWTLPFGASTGPPGATCVCHAM